MSKHTKKCPHCGTDIPADAKVCRKCGETLASGRIETLPQSESVPVQSPEEKDIPATPVETSVLTPEEQSADRKSGPDKKPGGNPWQIIAVMAVIVVIIAIAVMWTVNGNRSTDEAETTPVVADISPTPSEAASVADTPEVQDESEPDPVEDTVPDTPAPADSTPEATALPEGTEGSVVITDAANLRTGPGTEYEVAAVAAEGSYLSLMSTEGNWYLVIYDGQELYVHESLALIAVDPDAADAATVTTTDAVNVRSGPSAEYDVLGTATVGETMPTSGQTASGWYHVIYNGQSGFVAGAYVQYNE